MYLQLLFVSGYQDSNLGPPAPKAGALTGLRYTPFFNFCAKVQKHFILASVFGVLFQFKLKMGIIMIMPILC